MTAGIIRNNRKATVTITFANPADALEWLRVAQETGALQPDSALFQIDGIDEMVGDTGAPSANRFIVRRTGDRPWGEVTEEVTRKVSRKAQPDDDTTTVG